MSFAVKTSMLSGTSCRFSVPLRAVTTISCKAGGLGALRVPRRQSSAARGEVQRRPAPRQRQTGLATPPRCARDVPAPQSPGLPISLASPPCTTPLKNI